MLCFAAAGFGTLGCRSSFAAGFGPDNLGYCSLDCCRTVSCHSLGFSILGWSNFSCCCCYSHGSLDYCYCHSLGLDSTVVTDCSDRITHLHNITATIRTLMTKLSATSCLLS